MDETKRLHDMSFDHGIRGSRGIARQLCRHQGSQFTSNDFTGTLKLPFGICKQKMTSKSSLSQGRT